MESGEHIVGNARGKLSDRCSGSHISPGSGVVGQRAAPGSLAGSRRIHFARFSAAAKIPPSLVATSSTSSFQPASTASLATAIEQRCRRETCRSEENDARDHAGAALPRRGRTAEPSGLGDSGSSRRVQLHALLSHVEYHGFLAGDLYRLSWPMRQDSPRQRRDVGHRAV